MIGSVSAARIPLRNGSWERTSGNAAAVPTTVAISGHLEGDRQRRLSASWIWKSLNAAWYQCSVHPVIGSVPYRLALKLNRTSRMIGANRKK